MRANSFLLIPSTPSILSRSGRGTTPCCRTRFGGRAREQATREPKSPWPCVRCPSPDSSQAVNCERDGRGMRILKHAAAYNGVVFKVNRKNGHHGAVCTALRGDLRSPVRLLEQGASVPGTRRVQVGCCGQRHRGRRGLSMQTAHHQQRAGEYQF